MYLSTGTRVLWSIVAAMTLSFSGIANAGNSCTLGDRGPELYDDLKDRARAKFDQGRSFKFTDYDSLNIDVKSDGCVVLLNGPMTFKTTERGSENYRTLRAKLEGKPDGTWTIAKWGAKK